MPALLTRAVCLWLLPCVVPLSEAAPVSEDFSLDFGSPLTVSNTPPCRKSPDLHALFPVTHGDGGEVRDQVLLAFGGKGWNWTVEHHKKSGKASAKKKVQMLGDMWSFDLEKQEWHQIQGEPSPAARWKTNGAPVSNEGQLALFGGCTKTGIKGVQNDLWIFTPSHSGGSWRLVETERKPPKRRGHVVVHNGTHLVIFGGKTERKGDKCMRDLWSLPLASISEGSSSVPTWTQGASFPSGCRWGGTGDLMVAPTGEQYLGMFGGRHLAEGAEEHTKKKAAYTYYNDLWLYEFAKDRWFQADSTGEKPPARDHHGAATLSGQLFVYGGRQSEDRKAKAVLADIWSYSLETRSWTQHIPAGKSPSARFMPGVAAVRYHGVEMMAVFAGETLPGSTKRTTLNDVWVFDPAEATWTELFPQTCDLIPMDLLGPSSHEEFMTDLSRTCGAIAAAMAIMLVVKFAMASRRSAYALEVPETSSDCQDLTYRLL